MIYKAPKSKELNLRRWDNGSLGYTVHLNTIKQVHLQIGITIDKLLPISLEHLANSILVSRPSRSSRQKVFQVNQVVRRSTSRSTRVDPVDAKIRQVDRRYSTRSTTGYSESQFQIKITQKRI